MLPDSRNHAGSFYRSSADLTFGTFGLAGRLGGNSGTLEPLNSGLHWMLTQLTCVVNIHFCIFQPITHCGV